VKIANISQLKAHLNAYLADVRRGCGVVVCDRKTPVARLVPYEEDPSDFRVVPRARPVRSLKRIRGVPLKRSGDVLRILRESREER